MRKSLCLLLSATILLTSCVEQSPFDKPIKGEPIYDKNPKTRMYISKPVDTNNKWFIPSNDDYKNY